MLRLFRFLPTLLVLLALTVSSYADEPTPAPTPKPAVIVGPVGPDEADGSFAKPFIFTLGSKGKLTLATALPKASWNLDDCPLDTEKVGPDKKMLWFSTDTPGLYHAIGACTDPKVEAEDGPIIVHAWFRIKGANGPPIVEDQIALDTKNGFTGSDAKKDALIYQTALDGLRSLLSSGQITKTEQLTTTFKAGLVSAGWTGGKYPKITELAGTHLGNKDTPGHDLTPEEIEQLKIKLTAMSKGCALVIANGK